MISTESFSKERISQKSQELGYKDKPLLEKVIRAFSLLEMLVEAGAPIIFKGGSSLLLILKDSLNRLSIDIDVICPPGESIQQYLKGNGGILGNDITSEQDIHFQIFGGRSPSYHKTTYSKGYIQQIKKIQQRSRK